MRHLDIQYLSILVLLLLPFSAHAQAAGDEQKICQDAAQQLISEFGPSRATPEMHHPAGEPMGSTRKQLPTLPQGKDPIGPRVRMREEQRGNMADIRAEACFKIAVEIGRHYGLDLDGLESYEKLQQIREQRTKEQARQLSRPASCVIPGTSLVVAEGDTKCLVNANSALCPMCTSGYRHTCSRIAGTNDAQWVKVAKCLDSEKLSAMKLAESTGGGFNNLFTQQQLSVEAGYEERQHQQAKQALISQQPTVLPQSFVNPNLTPTPKEKPAPRHVDRCPSCQTVR